MASITIEDSYISSDGDMGATHLEAHSKEQNWLQDGEVPVEELTPTKVSDNSLDLALAMAVKMGVKSPDEWKIYNEKQSAQRKKDSYLDYVGGLCNSVTRNKEAALAGHKLDKQQRDRVAGELQSIRQRHGLAVDGALYYLGSVDEYSGDNIKDVRDAQAEALRTLVNSSNFKARHPGLFRAELHRDERGALHLQTQELWFKKSRNNHVNYAKKKIIEDVLTKQSNGHAFKDDITLLCVAHDPQFMNENLGYHMGKKKGNVRADFAFEHMAFDPKERKRVLDKVKSAGKVYPNAERKARIEELLRVADMRELDQIAKQVYPKYGLKWERDSRYATDGRHLTGPEYTTKHDVEADAEDTAKRTETAKQSLEAQRQEWYDNDAKLKQQRQELVNLDKVKQDLDTKQQQLNQQKTNQDNVAKQLQADQVALDSRKQALDDRERELDDRESKLNETLNEIKTDFIGWLQKRGHKVIADMMEKAFERLIKIQNQKKRQRILDEQAQQQADDMAVQFITESKQADTMAPTLHEQRKPEPYRKVVNNAYDNQLPSHQMAKKRPMTISEQIDAEIAKADAERKAKEKDKPTDTTKDKDEGFTL